jgi:methylmalonyl-CoA mutase, C-terminal domain
MPAGGTVSVLLAILGMDQHEVGARAVARVLRDAGMEVVYAGRFNLPAGIAKMAAEEDVDVIGLSCHSWEYLYYVDELLALLRQDARIPVIVGGSVITPADARALAAKGVAATFGPGATLEEIVATVRRLAAAGSPCR